MFSLYSPGAHQMEPLWWLPCKWIAAGVFGHPALAARPWLWLCFIPQPGCFRGHVHHDLCENGPVGPARGCHFVECHTFVEYPGAQILHATPCCPKPQWLCLPSQQVGQGFPSSSSESPTYRLTGDTLFRLKGRPVLVRGQQVTVNMV